jgi:hypothetical protein
MLFLLSGPKYFFAFLRENKPLRTIVPFASHKHRQAGLNRARKYPQMFGAFAFPFLL